MWYPYPIPAIDADDCNFEATYFMSEFHPEPEKFSWCLQAIVQDAVEASPADYLDDGTPIEAVEAIDAWVDCVLFEAPWGDSADIRVSAPSSSDSLTYYAWAWTGGEPLEDLVATAEYDDEAAAAAE